MLIAMRDRVGGLAGPLLVFALLIGSLMAGQFQRMRRQGVCLWITLLYAIVILFTLRIHLIIRPHLVSWAAVALLVMLLEDWQAGRRAFGRTLVAGTALLVIWTNLHGGFLLGLAIAGVYALDHGYQTLRGAHPAKFWQASCLLLLLLLLLLGLASLLNPWGWHLHLHLIAFLGNDFLMRSTTDFLPPIWANGTLPVLSLAVVAVVIPYSLRIRQVALKDWVLLFGLLYAAATSARNIPFFGIVMLPIAARYLQQWLDASEGVFAREVLGSSGRLEEDEGSRNGLAWPVIVAGCMTLLVVTGTMRVGLYSTNVPTTAIDWVNAQPELTGQPVFADYMFAGYLLYATPIGNVYLHALNANYPDTRLRNYFMVDDGDPGWELVLEGLDWAVVRADGGHNETLAGAACWRVVHADELAVVFNRVCDDVSTSDS